MRAGHLQTACLARASPPRFCALPIWAANSHFGYEFQVGDLSVRQSARMPRDNHESSSRSDHRRPPKLIGLAGITRVRPGLTYIRGNRGQYRGKVAPGVEIGAHLSQLVKASVFGPKSQCRPSRASAGAIMVVHRTIRFLISVCCLVLVVAVACEARGQSGAQAGQWRYYGGDAANTKYSALDQINKSNVAKVKVAWSWETPVGRRLHVREHAADG
jgi:hypothetical protein